MNTWRRLAAAFTLAPALALPAWAQQPDAYPSRQITFVVPFSAGIGTDALIRSAARRLADVWKRPVVVENLTGADTVIGTRRVARAPADGYTLLATTPALIFIRQLHPTDADLESELAPVSLLGIGLSALTVTGKVGVNSIEELKSHCRKPGAACSWGAGDLSNSMIGNTVMERMGLADVVTEVRYKGSNAALNDLLGGHVTMLISGAGIVTPLAGQVKILAVSAPRRVAALADVPTFSEAGFGSMQSAGLWVGVFAPKGTPEPIRRQLADALREANQDPGVVATMASMHMRAVAAGPGEFAEILKTDQAAAEKAMRRVEKK